MKGTRGTTPWLGIAIAIIPLLCLLVLQYRWLSELEANSELADQATLNNYLEAVNAEVEYFYRTSAERTLNVPWELFTEGVPEKALKYFAKHRALEGARRLFAFDLTGQFPRPITYDPVEHKEVWLTHSPELEAIYAAIAPWDVLSRKGVAVEQVSLTVDERDPDHRIILNPIADDEQQLVGVTGMVVEPSYFQSELLPATVVGALPTYFPRGSRLRPIVSVWDSNGDLVHTTREAPDSKLPPIDEERALSFPFSDWRLAIAHAEADASGWARSNFRLNLGLSAGLATALLSGILIAMRAASREMKLSQMKNEFVSNVSHELRTPLASIRVFGELLRLGRVDQTEKVREYGEFIEIESQRLTQLINNILDFSKIESGGREYAFEPRDLGALVDETLQAFRVSLRQKGFTIAFDRPPEDSPAIAMVDGDAIALCISNLIDNAVKYSKDQKVIEVAVTQRNRRAVISVRDYGIGIPRAEQAKIFDRFHRVSTGLVHEVRGSGLGLAIVQHIVEAHGGKVSVESRSGAGATFRLELPKAQERAAPARSPELPEGETKATLDGLAETPP